MGGVNPGEVKQQTPGSSIPRRGNKCILVLVKVVTLKWLWRPLPAGLARAQLHGGQFQVVPSASATGSVFDLASKKHPKNENQGELVYLA